MGERILVLANHYNTLRVFRRELLIALCAQNNQVLAVIPSCDEDNKNTLESYGCKVEFLDFERRGMNPIKDIWLFLKYIQIIKKFKPAKVITYTIKCNIYGAYAAELCHVPCYVNVTGLGSTFQEDGRTRKIISSMYKFSLKKAKKIFFENEGNRNTLVSDSIVRQDQTVVMHGAGVNLDQYPYLEYPSREDEIVFLFVGRIMQEKGVDELFPAIETICVEHPEVVFHFIGWYEDDYKNKVEELQAKGYIKFFGWQLDVVPFYQNAHCIIHPSWHEGMSNTLLEGAACGRPLITNSIHGCMEAVDDGINGFLCEKKNVESLLTAMRKFLSLSQNERRAMGQAGREKMKREFDKKDVVNATLFELDLC